MCFQIVRPVKPYTDIFHMCTKGCFEIYLGTLKYILFICEISRQKCTKYPFNMGDFQDIYVSKVSVGSEIPHL
jgi:hypothetical protein